MAAAAPSKLIVCQHVSNTAPHLPLLTVLVDETFLYWADQEGRKREIMLSKKKKKHLINQIQNQLHIAFPSVKQRTHLHMCISIHVCEWYKICPTQTKPQTCLPFQSRNSKEITSNLLFCSFSLILNKTDFYNKITHERHMVPISVPVTLTEQLSINKLFLTKLFH